MKYIYTLKQAYKVVSKMSHAVKCHSNVKLQVKVTRVQLQGYNVTHKSYNDVKG